MKVLPVVLLILAIGLISDAVIVHEGEFSFSLESVKKLWDILANGESTKPTNRLSVFSSVKVCENPLLPKEFQPLCQSKNAQVHFSRLALLSRNSDVCELCSFAACTGC
ncbi:guanylin [Ictalurus punctatus]|uniref:Guanylate cyclase activator 2B n=1 Tax=Ictalurus punctatus TaxID=7998 RepID=A0A2D0SJG7_ICTPU|nr:guanylin [Ictalurus punctatus]